MNLDCKCFLSIPKEAQRKCSAHIEPISKSLTQVIIINFDVFVNEFNRNEEKIE